MKINKFRLITNVIYYSFLSLFFAILIVLFFFSIETNIFDYITLALVIAVSCLFLVYPLALFINYYIIDKDKCFWIDKEKQIIAYKGKNECSEIAVSDIKSLYWFKFTKSYVSPSYSVIFFHNHPPILLTFLIISARELEDELNIEIKPVGVKDLFVLNEKEVLP